MSLVNGQVARTSDGDTALETPHSVNTSSISAHVTPEQGLFEGSQPDLDFGGEKIAVLSNLSMVQHTWMVAVLRISFG